MNSSREKKESLYKYRLVEDNKDTALWAQFLEMLELRFQGKTEGASDGSLLWESAPPFCYTWAPEVIHPIYQREEKK